MCVYACVSPSAVFEMYAPRDVQSIDGKSKLHLINLGELLEMMREGHMIDEELTATKVISVFSEVNYKFSEGGDDDESQELVYEEFLELLTHVCDLKVPAATREGVEFEETFQSWLQLVFIPTYRKLRLKAEMPGAMKGKSKKKK